MFHGREQFHGVKGLFLEVLGNVSCQLPDALEDEFSDFELLGVRSSSAGREWLNDLE